MVFDGHFVVVGGDASFLRGFGVALLLEVVPADVPLDGVLEREGALVELCALLVQLRVLVGVAILVEELVQVVGQAEGLEVTGVAGTERSKNQRKGQREEIRDFLSHRNPVFIFMAVEP